MSESFLSVLEKRASLAAEQDNAAGARDQLVASRPALERAAIRMSGIGLGDVETCDNTATADTGDAMGGVPNDPQADSSTGDVSAQGNGPSTATRISVIGSRSARPLSGGHDSQHVSLRLNHRCTHGESLGRN